jgi:hypothetical protein
VWHVACRYLDRVSYVTKSAAVFLVLMILSPVTAPFASFPLSALMGHRADTHASVMMTQADGSLASPVAGTVLVEEQMKDGEVILDGRLAALDTPEAQDTAPLAYRSTAAEGSRPRVVALRL